jgi:uncharacterized protein (TIGR02231 family)
MSKTVDTRISEITVYDDQALVTRRGVVQLIGEEHELVITQLPVTLLKESVRARSLGTVAVRLVGVRTDRTDATEALTQEIAKLTEEIGQVEEQKRACNDQLTLCNLQRNFVKSLSTQYLERLTRVPSPDLLNLNEIRELLDFVGQQYDQFSKVIATWEKEQQKLDQKLQALRQQLQSLSTLRPQESFRIIISLEPSTSKEFELEVSYVVRQASWVPLYDLRLNATDEKINISYLAEVKQSSGEDWLGAALTLSTAKPGLGSLPPKLNPWYIDVQAPSYAAQRVNAIAESGNLLPRSLAITMPYPGMTPEPEASRDSELHTAVEQIAESKQGGIVTLKVSSGSIPSDNTAHKTTIFNADYPCRAQYMAIPQLDSLAYLQTTITNPLSGVTLLPGQANIFRDNTFIGTTSLENIAPGQEFKLNLGTDEGLKIDRVLVERQVDKTLIANQKQTTYAYRLVITNLREQIAELTLIEQLPVSRNEQIKVSLTCTNPQIQIGEMGTLEWFLTLPPLSKQELYYQFTVEHPLELTVVGLDI